MVCQYHELDRHWYACASVCVCLCVCKWACMHIVSASPSIRVVGVGQRCLKYPQALTIQTWVTPLGTAVQRLALASTEPDKWNLIPPAMTAHYAYLTVTVCMSLLVYFDGSVYVGQYI